MRVAIVSDYYLDYVGGAQTSMLEQRAALIEAGHDVRMIASSRSARGEVPGYGLELRPSWTVPGVILPVISAGRRTIALLTDYLRRERIDVVHLQTEFGLAHAAIDAARALGIRVVHTVHTFYWSSTGFGPTLAAPVMRAGLQYVLRRRIPVIRLTGRPSDDLLRSITAATAERADVVISPSSHQADDLRAAGVTTPIATVPNPITRAPSPARELTLDDVAVPRFVWVARCEPEKRPLVFAAAAIQALGRARTHFEVDFVGDGAQRAELEQLTAGHPSLRVHGSIHHDRVIELIDRGSMVALTSYGFDNQPMTIAEGSSRYRGILYCDERLSEGLERSGHLSATPDAAGLADAVVALVDDPERLLALSRGARLDSSTFSPAAYVERVLEVYRG